MNTPKYSTPTLNKTGPVSKLFAPLAIFHKLAHGERGAPPTDKAIRTLTRNA